MNDKIVELSTDRFGPSALAERTNGLNDWVNTPVVKQFAMFVGPLGALFFRPVFA